MTPLSPETLLALGAASATLVGGAVWYHRGLGRLFPLLGLSAAAGRIPLRAELVLTRRGGGVGGLAVLSWLPVLGVVGLAARTVAAHRIHAEYGRGSGWTALFVLAPPLWATLFRWELSDHPKLASGEPGTATRVAFDEWGFTPDAEIAPTKDAAGIAALEAEPNPIAVALSAGRSCFAPAGAAVPFGAVVTQAGPPARTPPSARSAVPAVLPDDSTETDVTVRMPERPVTPRWGLRLPGGSTLALRADLVTLGRRPAAENALVIPDPSRTLSKTHARLRRDGNAWFVTDLNSTNGVFLGAPGPAQRSLVPGTETRVGEQFQLGTMPVRLVRGDE